MTPPEGPYIVHIDDEELNRRVFEASFSRTHRILTFSSGEETLRFLTQHGHEVAVLLSDNRMPGMSGLELLERSRQVAPNAVRMLVTAYGDLRTVIEAVNRGQVSRYFVKPWNREELAAAFDEALRLHDIHSRLREMEGRLRTSERLAAIGQLSAGIFHELMNPVSYISQNVSVLERELQDLATHLKPLLEGRQNERVDDILAEVPAILSDLRMGTRHLREIAEGVKAHVRTEAPIGECSFPDTVQLAVKLAQAAVRLLPRVVVEGGPVRVRGGQVQLCQILVNLLVNAAQAIEEHQRGGLIHIRWREEADFVHLQVVDDGPGIPAELQRRVFEPFFTTKSPGKGTGLGLAVCRDLAQRLGGDLKVSSPDSGGTTIHVTLVKAGPGALPTSA